MFAEVLAVAGIVVAFVAASSLWLRVRRSRSAGATDARPCCTRCWYPLGSWSGSKCPECGADARVLGVATGARFGRVLALMLALCAAVIVFSVGHVLAHAFDRVLVAAQRWTWVAASSGARVRFEARYGGPLHDDGLGATWFRGRLEFWPPKSTDGEPKITLLFDGPERPLAIDDVRRALVEVGGGADALATDVETRALHQMAAGLQLAVLGHAHEDGPLWSGTAPIEPWGQLSGDGAFTPSPSTRGIVLATLAAAAVLGVGFFLALRCFSWGTRRAREGEWVTATRDGVASVHSEEPAPLKAKHSVATKPE
jgi:hypothetical protein